jgi:hypothetical protein
MQGFEVKSMRATLRDGGRGAFFLSAALLVCSLTFQNPAQAQISLQVFADPHPLASGGTIGFTYAGNKFVGSVQGDGLGILYATDLDGTNVRLFAPTVAIPAGSILGEHYVAASLGLGGFPSRDIYVAAGTSILHITNDGSASDVLVKNLASPVRGMVFDSIGTFDHDLLVSTFGGQIYRVNSSGVARLLASVGEDAEGMDIVPLGAHFGGFDGQLLVVSEGSGLLRAISTTGTVSELNASHRIPDAERVSIVPLDLGASGSPVEGLYEANFQPNVLKASWSQFEPFKGDAIVTTELMDRRISRVHWGTAGLEITVVGNFPIQAEDGVFVTPTIINPGCPAIQDSRQRFRDDWCAPFCKKTPSHIKR